MRLAGAAAVAFFLAAIRSYRRRNISRLSLLTAFVAAAVGGIFPDTIAEIVVLAVFLPVLAGQSGNTGCQALAVALRGMTLGELRPGREKVLLFKEGLLGLLNGALVGVTAGAGFYIYTSMQGTSQAWLLGLIVFVAMTVMNCTFASRGRLAMKRTAVAA